MSTEKNHYKDRLRALGSFEALEVAFDTEALHQQLAEVPQEGWKVYNKSKPGYNRYGLSLISLDGSTDGEIDLNSLLEYNKQNGTHYDELSFRTPTPFWRSLSALSSPLEPLLPHLGRSHLIRLDQGGIFPPHRDLGAAVRLIAFFDCAPNSLHFTLNNQVQYFESFRLHYADTDRVHSLVSFQKGSLILVLNVDPNPESYQFIINHLQEI
jgi:hypothetical protein